MAGIPEEIIREVRDRSDIVEIVGRYVQLRSRGKDFWGLCPFHQEKTPSFKVSPQYQAFYCFGCRRSGNVFHFIMEVENVDFPSAVRLLAQHVGVVIPERSDGAGRREGGGPSRRETLLRVLREAADWYHRMLVGENGAAARAYLEERGVTEDDIRRFFLGFAPQAWDAVLRWAQRKGFSAADVEAAGLVVGAEDGPGSVRRYDRFRGRLMFPIWDELGRVVGFSGRLLDPDAKEAKYVNTPETEVFHKGRLLYALHLARTAFREFGAALVCEGQLDVIACHRAGFTHAVAPQGTAFSELHARLLRRFTDRVVFAMDADEAGQKAAARSVRVAVEAGLHPMVAALPPGEDPDSLLQNKGPDAFRELLDRAADGIEFILRRSMTEHDATSPEGRSAVVRNVLEVVALVPDRIARIGRCQWLARVLDLPENAVLNELRMMLRERMRASRRWERGGPSAASAVTAPAPSAALLDRSDRARLMLLDLALHDLFIAERLAERMDPAFYDSGPISRALGVVLACAADGTWEEAGRIITGDEELGKRPDILRAVTDPEFPPIPPDRRDLPVHADEVRKRERAMADCLAVLEQEVVGGLLREVHARLREENLPESEKRKLLEQYQQLRRRQQHLARADHAV